MKTNYRKWPLGQLPERWQRPELKQLREKGYEFGDPWEVVEIFERKIAEYAGSDYAVAVDNCTNAIFLCLKYLQAKNIIYIPKRTYVSIPMAIINAGCEVEFENVLWEGLYGLIPYPILDGAGRFTRNMYVPDYYHCLSFQMKKRLPIGKGGMILTNDKEAKEWFKLARYEGRNLKIPYEKDDFDVIGWNMYMTPEDAARGILMFDYSFRDSVYNWPDVYGYENYSDLSEKKIFKCEHL